MPELTFDSGPFRAGLKALQEARYSAQLEGYTPSDEDSYESIFDEVAPPDEGMVRLKMLYAKWVDLHVATRRNLKEFEDRSFVLPERATGHDPVKKLVGSRPRIFVFLIPSDSSLS